MGKPFRVVVAAAVVVAVVVATGAAPAPATVGGAGAGAWSPAGAPPGLASGMLVGVGAGRVLLLPWSPVYDGSSHLYDSATGTWSASGSTSSDRYSAALTALAGGGALVAGGQGSEEEGVLSRRSAEAWDPVARQWSATGAMQEPRQDHTATLLADGRVLVVGGFSSRTSGGGWLSSAEIWNPATGAWELTGSMSTARSRHLAVKLADGRVLVAGGRSSTKTIVQTAEIWDPLTGSWSSAGTTARRIHGALSPLADGRAIFMGGFSGISFDGYPYGDQATAEVFDPVSATWSPTGTMRLARTWTDAVLLGDGRVLVAGGADDYMSPEWPPAATAEAWDPATGTWSTVRRAARARDSAMAEPLGDGRALVFGGYPALAEVFDPSVPAPAPSLELRPYKPVTSAQTGNGYRFVVTAGDGPTGFATPGRSLRFVVTDGPNAGIASGAGGSCVPNCTTDSVGDVQFYYQSQGYAGTDHILVFDDADSDGAVTPGEATAAFERTWILRDTRLTASPAVVATQPRLTTPLGDVTARLTYIDDSYGSTYYVRNVVVRFSVGGRVVCEAVTDVYGVARCRLDVTDPALLTEGYRVTYDGDGRFHEPAAARGQVVR